MSNIHNNILPTILFWKSTKICNPISNIQYPISITISYPPSVFAGSTTICNPISNIQYPISKTISYPPSGFARSTAICNPARLGLFHNNVRHFFPFSAFFLVLCSYNLENRKLLKHDKMFCFELFPQEYLLWNKSLTVAYFYWIESLKLKKNEVLDAFIVWAGRGGGLIAQPCGFQSGFASQLPEAARKSLFVHKPPDQLKNCILQSRTKALNPTFPWFMVGEGCLSSLSLHF